VVGAPAYDPVLKLVLRRNKRWLYRLTPMMHDIFSGDRTAPPRIRVSYRMLAMGATGAVDRYGVPPYSVRQEGTLWYGIVLPPALASLSQHAC
jgi:hypothetical protein